MPGSASTSSEFRAYGEHGRVGVQANGHLIGVQDCLRCRGCLHCSGVVQPELPVTSPGRRNPAPPDRVGLEVDFAPSDEQAMEKATIGTASITGASRPRGDIDPSARALTLTP